MSQTVTAGPYNAYQSQAMIGMKADSMDDNVDTFAAAAPIPFGVVVSRVSTANLKVQKGGTAFVGIAIHDHIIGSRAGYIQYDAVSVLTRGRVWAKLKSAVNVQDGAYVGFDATTGEVSAWPAPGGTKLLNAVFRSASASLPDAAQVIWGDGTTSLGAVVELHYPFADPAATTMMEAEITEETQKYFDDIEERNRQREEQREEQRLRDEELQRQNEAVSQPRQTRAEVEAEARRRQEQGE